MNRSRTFILSVIAIAILCFSVMGLTFAYFSSPSYVDAETTVNVESSNNAYIYYDTGKELDLTAKQPGYSGELSFSVKLVGENKQTLNSMYDVNLYISENTFEYDPKTSIKTPELLLDIYMSTDNKTWNEVILNKDVTELEGEISLLADQKITANKNMETTQYWKILVRYESLDKDQSYNMNKKFISAIKVENVE